MLDMWNGEDGCMRTVSEQLLREIKTCGVTRYRISQETGIEESVLSRFVTGKRGLSMEAIDKLAAYFELELKRKGK